MAKICFLMGSLAISGGTYVVLQHAVHLKDQGHDVTLAAQEPFDTATVSWHDGAHKLNLKRIEQVHGDHFDIVVATWWKTAFEMLKIRSERYAYFVQSIESRFYPDEEVPLKALVDATYDLPVSFVTEASWIVDHLKQNHGQSAFIARNGIRKDWYTPDGPKHSDRITGSNPRVLIEGHLGVPFKNVALSLKAARKAGAKDIWMLTGSPVSRLPGVNKVFSRVPAWETAQIYRSCDFLVKLSTVEGMFGPPLEHFHCGGTCVVFDVSGHDEYIVNHVNGLVLSKGDASGVVTSIRRLLNDNDLLQHLKGGALRTAETWPDWYEASVVFSDWMEAALNGPVSDTGKMDEILQNAMSIYDRDERIRLDENKDIELMRKREARWNSLPQRIRDYRRAFNFKKEVVLQDWTTR